MLLYCVPTLNSFDTCAKSIDAVMRGTLKPDKIRVLDNSGTGAGRDYMRDYLHTYKNLEIHAADKNHGVAGSWNWFMQSISNNMNDDIIIANDDIEVHEHTLEAIVTHARRSFDQIFFAGSGYSGNAFSLFMLAQLGYKLVGAFDEKFYPAYFEDNDYYRRMNMYGYSIVTVEDATYDHVGSSTLKRYTPEQTEEHHKAFRKNQAYYTWKWGGPVGQETRTEPQTL